MDAEESASRVARPGGTPEGRGPATFGVPPMASTVLDDHALPQSLQGVPPVPESAMEVEESAEPPPHTDEEGFDERPRPRDSTGKSVRSSVCPGSSMHDPYGSRPLPHLAALDRKGIIRLVEDAPDDMSRAALWETLEQLLSE